MDRTTVLIADDHTLVAEGLRRIVEREFYCVGIVTNGDSAIKAAARNDPDVILLDISMPEMDGLEVARRIREVSHTKIFIVSMIATPEYIKEALAVGASGYITKECAGTQLLAGIREILCGETYVRTEISECAPSESSRPESGAMVTLRQREVLERVIRGLPAKIIAHQLSISPKTVEFHKKTMMRTLSVRTTAELIRFAIENCLVESRISPRSVSAPSS